MFEAVEDESPADREIRILKIWEEEETFKRSVEQRKGNDYFSSYDGPPFATGLPHYGHLLASVIKDVVPRYKAMKGYYAPRRFGWDCHGLPVENEIEKAKHLSGAASIEEYGIPKFNEDCREIVLRYTEEWKHTINRIGRWVDFDQIYKTMDLHYMESVWWVFKELFNKGLVYKGYKVMPFSAKLGTPLSNFEASENYKDVDDPSVTIAFPLLSESGVSFLAWTTTPWTLISHLALIVGADLDYVKVRDKKDDKRFILAKARLAAYYKDEAEYEILESYKGKDLEGIEYEPPFDYFKDERKEGAFRVLIDEFVSTEDGTGIVHAAPGFGETDFYVCQRYGINVVCPVDKNGQFMDEISDYKGLFVKDADKAIIKNLKEQQKIVQHGTINHRYPYCWRSDTPLIYRVQHTWFVAVEKVKDKIIKANEQIHWTPGHLKHGRFGKWLEGARDWAISRSRYWGTPIPLWVSDDGDVLVTGSLAELEELTGEAVTDIHRHFIDELIIEKAGKTYRRIPEVFDCWFESGSMPYAQNHYPFENQKLTEKTFPADFIAEGLDQTRGWFYTLTVLAAALFDKPAFKNVIVNGILLAGDGTKMSKRLRNYPDPEAVLAKHGADAVRLYLLNSPAVRADDLSFHEKGVELVLRQVIIPFWNAYVFFVTYVRIYEWSPAQFIDKKEAVIDQWILSKFQELVKDVDEGMEHYDLSSSVKPFIGFIDQLTNWYIRRSKRRFWSDEDSMERREAFSTLYTVLLTLTRVAAPFAPFISEVIYRNLAPEHMPKSVHLCDFPSYEGAQRDMQLEQEMAVVQVVTSLGHSLRKEHKIKVRQPLAIVHVASGDLKTLEFLKHQKYLIADELNVKEVTFHEDESQFVVYVAKPNFKTLGRRLGKRMKEAQKVISGFVKEQMMTLMSGNTLTISLGEEAFTLEPGDVELDRQVHEGMIAANEGMVTVVLETQLNDELVLEGLSRELVSKMSTMRRNQGLEISDRIHVYIDTTERVKESFSIHGDHIKAEVLAVEVIFAPPKEGVEWSINGEHAVIEIVKA